MKRENWVYLFAFLCGVVAVNILGSDTWANNSILNRYSLAMLSFQEITYEVYFLQVLLLRFRTIAGLWILSKLKAKKAVIIGFAAIVSAMLGAILAMLILANGVWGISFFLCALLPHGIFYVLAYVLWYNAYSNYTVERNKRENRFAAMLIFILIVVGSICEAYICPVFIEKVINL